MKKWLVLFSALLIVTSCNPPGHDTPIATVEFQPDGNGYVQFKTNDPQYYDYYWWHYYTSTLELPTMTTVTGTLIKVSGSLNYGAGLMFCYQDSSNYYVVLISCDGYYLVGRTQAGAPNVIKGWTATSNITQGLGMSNVVSINRTGSHSFDVFINDMLTPLYSFTDSNLPESGYAGFYVQVGTSAYEHFPDTPMDVRLKLTSPINIP